MKHRYFIMLNWQDGRGAMPVVRDDVVEFFETSEEALKVAKEMPYAQACGFKIFDLNDPIIHSEDLD